MPNKPLFGLLCGGGTPRGAAALSTLPKPLHLVRGTPVAQLVLESIPAAEVLVVASRALEDVNFQSTLPHLAKGKRLRFATLQRATRGPVETAYLGLMAALGGGEGGESEFGGSADALVASADVQRPVAFFDNDTVYDLGSAGASLPWGAHFIGTTLAPDATEIAPYCYVRLAPGGAEVTEVAEKRKISAHYASGVYGFASVAEFMHVARVTLLGNGGSESGNASGRPSAPVASDFFMSACYDCLLRGGIRVTAVPMANPICLGTPADIAKNASRLPFRQLRLCFDVDNTVLQYKDVDGSYRDCKPVARIVQLIRRLKAEGHTIVLYTARGMASAKSNVGQLQATVGRDTFESLAQLGLPYDEIYFGKPHADVYVVSAHFEL